LNQQAAKKLFFNFFSKDQLQIAFCSVIANA